MPHRLFSKRRFAVWLYVYIPPQQITFCIFLKHQLNFFATEFSLSMAASWILTTLYIAYRSLFQLYGSQNAHKEEATYVPAARKLLDSLSKIDVRAYQRINIKWERNYISTLHYQYQLGLCVRVCPGQIRSHSVFNQSSTQKPVSLLFLQPKTKIFRKIGLL